MAKYNSVKVPKSERITRLVEHLYAKLPEIESARAVLLTESYRQTEDEPEVMRKAKAFAHILDHIPIIIREEELIVGSSTIAPRGCQTFPEFSFEWLESEFDTVATREADPFYISEQAKKEIAEADKYWKGKTTSELATSYMAPETLRAMAHNMFTPGNYFYNGVGHVTVQYEKVLAVGFEGIMEEVRRELASCSVGDADYATKHVLLESMLISCAAVIRYANRYADLAESQAAKCGDGTRKQELLTIAANCRRVPAKGAETFWEACQSFWFVQQLLQMESSGHSISPGRFDQYMYPYYQADLEAGRMTREQAQELIDCVWVKLNDLNKCRDAESAKGFAGYSLFQNLIVGGQNAEGLDVTNDLSFMCIDASAHVFLPQPSLSIRVWNGSPHELLVRAAELTRTGIGLPAYYNDEVIIPSLMSRGLTLEDARTYNIIGCVEPQKAGKTWGWHDAAFYNMCRPLEMVFSNGMDCGEQIGPKTGDVEQMQTFEEFYDAYKIQQNYFISLLVNADNSIDQAHADRAPLPFLASMVDDCIKRGKTCEQGGCVYNFTGPQGFGIANVADSLAAIDVCVFKEKYLTMAELMDALATDFAGRENIRQLLLNRAPKFGNNDELVDDYARALTGWLSDELQFTDLKDGHGGRYTALVSTQSYNVTLGEQVGAMPDGRHAFTPQADNASPMSGRDTNGPTAALSSVAYTDLFMMQTGELVNQRFDPALLRGEKGLDILESIVRGYFEQYGEHLQVNVVDTETLRAAQKNPKEYQNILVRVAGYSAYFVELERKVQDDIISRTLQNCV